MALEALPRCPSGMAGLDELTRGGLPLGRSSLVCGEPGCGKSIFGMQFLVKGATEYNEPGVLVSFEERPEEILLNMRSFDYEADRLADEGKLAILHLPLDPSEMEEIGAYDLEGLFVRLGHQIDKIGAKRVAIDTIENLFGVLKNELIVRAELQRLFGWLKDKGVTSIITAERGHDTLTRHGLEEYVSDCVILLDHRIEDQVATRRLRVVKYRGSEHGTGEYPFLIDADGITVVPITSLGLEHSVSRDAVSSGVKELDAMLGMGGFYRGSTVLVSGAAGTGKSSLAGHFVQAACERGEKAMYFAFEESRDQIVRNMGSIGLDLGRQVDGGALRIVATRPSLHGLEHHLSRMHKLITEFDPSVVVLDPITDFEIIGTDRETKSMITRLVDFLKARQITGLFTSMTNLTSASEVGISSLIDTWLQLRNIENGGEQTRALYVLKARGMPHSNQVREFILTDDGVRLVDVYVGPDGILTGSAREAQQSREALSASSADRLRHVQRDNLDRKRRIVDARIAALEAEYEAEASEIQAALAEAESDNQESIKQRQALAERRRIRNDPESSE